LLERIELMMTINVLKKAHDLVKRIEEQERLVAAYREADEVTVGLKHSDRRHAQFGFAYQVCLTRAETGDLIVDALVTRLAAMQEELRKLGIAVMIGSPASRRGFFLRGASGAGRGIAGLHSS
jgi:hypothetical protein